MELKFDKEGLLAEVLRGLHMELGPGYRHIATCVADELARLDDRLRALESRDGS